ncbi:MmsAB operon transcriptional regulator MmsR, partial [Pseudomonas aeruginosa]
MDYIAEPATDMSHTSDWPLPADSLRLPIPAALLEKLAVHPLSRDLYPTSLGHYRRARDHRMSRERHDEHLLIYCSEGQGLLRVREGEAWREYRVGSGDLLWLPPGMAHDYAADDRQPWTIF